MQCPENYLRHCRKLHDLPPQVTERFFFLLSACPSVKKIGMKNLMAVQIVDVKFDDAKRGRAEQ